MGTINAAIKGGLVVGSIYLRHTEGLTEANWQLAIDVAHELAKLGRPFVVGGDFQMDPKVIAAMSIWGK